MVWTVGGDPHQLITHGSLNRPAARLRQTGKKTWTSSWRSWNDNQMAGWWPCSTSTAVGRNTRPVGSVRQGKRRAHDLLCAAVDAQVKQAAAVDRARRTAHVELVPWARAGTTRMMAHPAR